MKWDHCIIADLHVGSWRFDRPALQRILNQLRADKVKCRTLHLIGDLIEGKLNYKGQLYEARPIEEQQKELIDVLMLLFDVLRPKEIFILVGNHDKKYGLDLLYPAVIALRDKLRRYRTGVHYIVDPWYTIDSIMFMHGIPGYRGSRYTGVSPALLNALLSQGLVVNANVVVLGHYHKQAVIRYMNKLFIVVPAFKYLDDPLRNDRAVLLMKNDGTFRWVETYPTPPQTLRATTSPII